MRFQLKEVAAVVCYAYWPLAAVALAMAAAGAAAGILRAAAWFAHR